MIHGTHEVASDHRKEAPARTDARWADRIPLLALESSCTTDPSVSRCPEAEIAWSTTATMPSTSLGPIVPLTFPRSRG
jgi:hypothetical protein